MGLTRITSDGITDGTITGTDLATNVDLVDNQKLRLGTGNDLQIYHDGSHNYIEDTGTGNLFLKSDSVISIRGTTIALKNAANSETLLKCVQDGAVELYYDNDLHFATTSQGCKTNGDLSIQGDGGAEQALFDVSDGSLKFVDNIKAKFGSGDDLQIFHDGNSRIQNTNNSCDFRIQSDSIELKANSVDEMIIKGVVNGSVELYHNNSKKLYTNTSGIVVQGDVFLADSNKFIAGNSSDLQIYHDGSHSYIDNNTGSLRFRDAGGAEKFRISGSGTQFNDDITLSNDNDKINIGASNDLQIYHDGNHSYIEDAGTGNLILKSNVFRLRGTNDEEIIIGNENGNVQLYHNNSLKFRTGANGFDAYGSSFNLEASDSGAVNLRLQNTTTGNGVNDGFLLQLDSSEHAYVWHRENKNLVFGTNDSTRFLITSDGHLRIPNDSGKLQLGASQDLQIFHDGSNSFIQDSGTGDLFVRTTAFKIQGSNSDDMIAATQDGAVELYFDNTLRFSTNNSDNSGNRFYGALSGGDSVPIYLGNSNDLTLLHDGTDCRIRYNHTVGELKFQLNNNNTVASFNTSGHFVPGSNNTYDLGTSSLRWANVYTNDLNLSNEGGSNDVDGTWGSYTIQEGAEDLFLVNKRNGKKYKFNLTEVL